MTLTPDRLALEQIAPDWTWLDAHTEIEKVLERFGLNPRCEGLYLGDESVDAVRCVLAVGDLSRNHSWFSPCIEDARMLRIEESSDLVPAIRRS